jgi:hypothetical protein
VAPDPWISHAAPPVPAGSGASPGYAPPGPGYGAWPAPGSPPSPPSPPGPPSPARRGKALPILIGVLGMVLVLFVAAGFVAYRTFFDGVKAPSRTAEEVTGDLSRYKTGDCLSVDDATNNVEPATCSDAGAYKVLLRKDGTIDDSVCRSTDATMSLYEDADGTARDFVLCVGPAA